MAAAAMISAQATPPRKISAAIGRSAKGEGLAPGAAMRQQGDHRGAAE